MDEVSCGATVPWPIATTDHFVLAIFFVDKLRECQQIQE